MAKSEVLSSKQSRLGREKSGVDDRDSVHPSGDQSKVVMKTRSSSKKNNDWDLDEQAIQLGRNPRKHPATAEGRTG